MQRVTAVVKLICLLLLAILLSGTIGLEITASVALRDVQHQIANIGTSSDVAFSDLDNTIGAVGALAESATVATKQLNQTEQQQAAYWNKTSAEMYKTMAALRLVIVRTDRTLNDQLGPQLTGAVVDSDSLIRSTSTELAQNSAELAGSIASLTRASDAAAAAMSDPHLAETLSRVDDASEQLAGMSWQLNATAGHVENMSAMAETRVRQLLKPASLAVRIGTTLLGIATSAGSIAAGFFK